MPLLEEPAPRPWVVLLTGHEGHGKTEAARWLERWEGFARVSFADPLRKSLVALGVPVRAFEQDSKLDPLATHGGRTPRELMQGLGDHCRSVSPDLLARAWDRGLPPPPASVVGVKKAFHRRPFEVRCCPPARCSTDAPGCHACASPKW